MPLGLLLLIPRGAHRDRANDTRTPVQSTTSEPGAAALRHPSWETVHGIPAARIARVHHTR